MQFLLAVSEHFGDPYLTHIMLPVFLVAVGESADLAFFPSAVHSRIKGKLSNTFCNCWGIFYLGTWLTELDLTLKFKFYQIELKFK